MLFRYRLELAKANVLARAIQFLHKFGEKCRQNLPFELAHVKLSHSRIKNDVKDDYDLIRDTLDMVILEADRR